MHLILVACLTSASQWQGSLIRYHVFSSPQELVIVGFGKVAVLEFLKGFLFASNAISHSPLPSF